MAITIGQKLGSYEVLSLVGRGGMGEVYKARDVRLDRIVAIKVLPSNVTDSSELRGRFEREARTISSLNHPNICVLHDVGNQDGIDFLIMEYLEGESLAQRLTRGPLPFDQALQCAIEIAGALDKAHRSDVTHRDLKPGNIMMTKAGAKLLDFGLAKLKQDTQPVEALSSLPTNADVTAKGTILGTLQYMSPEQLEGNNADPRSDIFSFGAVLYEMLTGKKAFEGKSQASVIAAILEREPPVVSSLQPMTPPGLDRLLKKCLAKDPESRWQSASDMRDELQWIKESGDQRVTTAPLEQKRVRRIWARVLVWSVAAAVFAAVAVSAGMWKLDTRPLEPVIRFAITPPGDMTFGSVNSALGGRLDNPAVAISPDGTQLAYIGSRAAIPQLYLRSLDRLEVRPIEGTVGVNSPFFSPDGQWLGLVVGGVLKKISIAGGSLTTVSNWGSFFGASWMSGDRIAVAVASSGLLQVSVAGGTPQPLTKLDASKGELAHAWPQVLPGGDAVLFTVQTTGGGRVADTARIAVENLKTGERKILVQEGTYGRYLASGHLVYLRMGTLTAVPFDLKRLAVTGSAVPIIEGVRYSPYTGGGQFSVSDRGALAYIPGNTPSADRKLVWVDRKGVEQPISAPSRPYTFPRLSPDGRMLAIESQGDIWVFDIPRGTLSRLTFAGINSFPIWSPDGRRIAYNSAREGKPESLFWKPADGSGPEERLSTSERSEFLHSFSPDGQLLAFVELSPGGDLDIWTLPASGDHKPRLYFRTPFMERGPKFSPDGRWLAYASDETGRLEIYVQPFPGPGAKTQISTDGGMEPVWAPNGELFYWNGNRLMAVQTTTKPAFSAGSPRLVLEGAYERFGGGNANYAVTADGQRFVMVKAAGEESPAPSQINIVLNWFTELRQRVPAK